MLPEVGGTELIVIAIVALIVVGPKDLPLMLRKIGQFVGKLRGMASEFRASFDEMARQSELDELRKEVDAMRRGQLADQATQDAASADMSRMFDDIGSSLQGSGVQFHPPMSHQFVTAAEPTIIDVAPPKPKVRKSRATAKAVSTKTAAKRVIKPKAGTVA